ncbi:MAG TPA: MFS transporter [Cycloclasticus sp.]|jgi:MFS family permease|nr:MFS transporter [Cycloclasticus sp.]
MTHPSTTQWNGIWLSFLTGVVAAIAVTKASPALLAMKQELALSIVQIGWIMSSVAIATVLLGVFAGSLSRRIGPKKVLQLALALICLASSFGLLIESPSQLLASRIIEGIGIIFISVSAPTLISHLSKPSDMGLSMGVWALWMPIGSVLVFLLSPLILQHLGWHWLWASSAVVALPLMFFLRLIPNLTLHQATENNPITAPPLKSGAVVLALIFICFTGIFFSFITYLPAYLVSTYQLSNNQALLITTLLPVFIIPGNLISGFFIHKGISPAQMMAYPAATLTLIMSCLFQLEYPVWLGLILLACFGFFLGMIPTAIFAQAPRMAAKPIDIGRVMGIVITGQGIGILLSPPLAGYLIGEQQLWHNVYPLLVTFAVLIILLIKPLLKQQARVTAN